MIPSTGNPLRDLELRIEAEGEEYKRRRYAEELQKLADSVPVVSPPQPPSAPPPAPPQTPPHHPRRRRRP